MLEPVTIMLTISGIFIISFMKGAFGGGFATIGIPLLALVMDPLAAGALLAPLFVAMDLAAWQFWKPANWSRPDLLVLLPGLVAGIGLGTILLDILDGRAIAILVALVTLAYSGMWFLGDGRVVVRPRSSPKGIAAGIGTGISTMVAHAGGPPLALYLLRLGLPATLYAGTTHIVFSLGNAIKVVPWLWVGKIPPNFWWLMIIALPAVPVGVRLGWKLHGRLDQNRLYQLCYGLLVATGLLLLWNGISGYLS